jgi:hypothetical protein
MRGSDEAIVSDNLAGQHNPLGSQGPLDGIDQCDELLCRLKRVHPLPLRLALRWAAVTGNLACGRL